MGARLAALHEPEDVLQDTLLFALQRRPALDPEQAALAWLGSLADARIQTLVAQARPRARPRRGTALPASQMALDLDALLRAPAAVEGNACPDDRELAAHRLRALSRLSFEQRTSLVLRGFSGLPWSTIGTVLGRSAEAARSLHARALRSLLEVLRRSAEPPRGSGASSG